MPQDSTKDHLKAECVVVAGDPLEAALSMKWQHIHDSMHSAKVITLPPILVSCHNHTLCLQVVFCNVLGHIRGYLLHLSDIFLILWLVSNLVESLF